MYIIELILKWLKDEPYDDSKTEYFNEENNIELEDTTKCEHVYLPIDSTKKILACSKCGKILKIKGGIPSKSKNFFKNDL